MTHELTIIFPTKKAKTIFATWMSDGGGEQDYFRAMEKSKTPSLRIGYHGPEDTRYELDDKRRYGAFLADNTLRVTVCEDDSYVTSCVRCGETLKGVIALTATLCGLCADDEINNPTHPT